MATGSKTASPAASVGDGIFRQLADEHAEVNAMLERVAGTIEIRVRQELFPEIRRSLLEHARGEEEVFYAALREHETLGELVARSQDEHAEVERFLNRLDVKDKSTKQWGDLFGELVQAVRSHLEREENELFPRARDLLDPEQAKHLGERYLQAVQARSQNSLS